MGSNIHSRRKVTGRAGLAFRGPMGEPADSYRVIPLVGVARVGAAAYVRTLILRPDVFPELDGEPVAVYHDERCLGWLQPGLDTEVKARVQHGLAPHCVLHSVEDSPDEPRVFVGTWL